MSTQAREQLVSKLVFQDGSQKSDLLNPSLTQTTLIALLLDLADKGHHIEITAVRSDHDNDSALGLHCHHNGYCADLWPLGSATPGDYLDANNPYFQQFLKDAAASVWLHQIGLAGTAWNDANVAAGGSTVFHDDGADHVHLGAE
ncbi:MAG: hypothetical protein WAL67_16770 [Candidatus Cybelea sp.]